MRPGEYEDIQGSGRRRSSTAKLVNAGILKAQTIRDQVRRHLVFGWYFLPAGEENPQSIVDLRDIHTVPRDLLEEQSASGIDTQPL